MKNSVKINQLISEQQDLYEQINIKEQEIRKLGRENYCNNFSIEKLSEEFLPLPDPIKCKVEFVIGSDGLVSDVKYDGPIPKHYKNSTLVKMMRNNMNAIYLSMHLSRKIKNKMWINLDYDFYYEKEGESEKLAKKLVQKDKRQKAQK